MTELEKNEWVNFYCTDDMKNIKKISYTLMAELGGISQKDYDDFYSIAQMTLLKAFDTYDEKIPFEKFFRNCLKKKYFSELRDRNRDVRKANNGKYAISISTLTSGEGNSTIEDTLVSDFRIEDELDEKTGFSFGENIQKYLDSLSETQRFIAKKVMDGHQHQEIREMLKISENKYKRILGGMNTLEKLVMINQKDIVQTEEEKSMNNVQSTQTAEKSKPMQYSISSIIKKMESRTIRFDHPLQRESDQWSPAMKGNLISDILQGNPLPEIVFAEQIINGIPIIWDLDGKQRCTNCYSFIKDGFKISKNIRRWNIEYVSQVKNEDGEIILDDNGFPMSEYKVFDIKNKKFSQLPPELQEKFMDYTFKCDQYLNCNSEDIAYHIIRYNEGKNMNKAQKGIARIGEEFATIVKSISAMPFFREKGGYKMSDAKNGTLERVVVESIMSCNFLDAWKKEQEYICEYLKDNATEETFDSFEDLVNRLELVITDEAADMFNSKDSFIWFSLFAKFVNTGENDEKFIEFMAEFTRSLHNKVIDGVSYDSLCVDKETGKARATKDKYIVIPKMKLLEKLMLDFLHIEVKDDIDTCESISTYDFIKENVSSDIELIDVEIYESSLNDYTVEIDESAKQIVDENIQSFVALVAYAFTKDVDDEIHGWLINYALNPIMHSHGQKENYLHMKKDFKDYLYKKGVAA